MLICILTKNVITSCSVTMMLFLHLEVKPLMTLTTVLYLSCALISGHLAMIDRKSGSAGMPRPISYAVFCLKKKMKKLNNDVDDVLSESLDCFAASHAYILRLALHSFPTRRSSDLDQERDYFMQRYHDVISSFGGKTSYDADNRPLLVMRSNLWASGYDVDGTDQTSLGQFSGRVQQTYKHSVPRFFVPEHGTMFTLALVRFPPTATKEIQYLNAKGALTYTDIAGDPVLYGNLPPR